MVSVSGCGWAQVGVVGCKSVWVVGCGCDEVTTGGSASHTRQAVRLATV